MFGSPDGSVAARGGAFGALELVNWSLRSTDLPPSVNDSR
jgi:hypothetical protein